MAMAAAEPAAHGPAGRGAIRGGLHRRSLLAAVGGAAAAAGGIGAAAASGAFGPGHQAADSQRSAAWAARRKAAGPLVDMHHHAMPSEIHQWLVRHGKLPPVGGPPFAIWSLRSTLGTMDANGIQVAILSAAIPSVFVADRAQATELARIANTAFAELVRSYPARFGFLAYLPLPYVDAALAELAYAFDTLHADGVIMMSHAGPTYLGDPVWEPVMAELDRRSATVLTHPYNLPGAEAAPVPPFLVDFLADTTRGAIQLVHSGTLDRYRRIKFVLPHGGGVLPYAAGRLILGAGLGYGSDAETVARALRRFYYDTAGPMSPYATPSLLVAAGADHILFGSDYNAVPAATVAAGVTALVNDAALTDKALTHVGRANALALLPGVAGRLSSG
jgi:predicted TIM-barrel fold metal-dependent hydrolase